MGGSMSKLDCCCSGRAKPEEEQNEAGNLFITLGGEVMSMEQLTRRFEEGGGEAVQVQGPFAHPLPEPKPRMRARSPQPFEQHDAAAGLPSLRAHDKSLFKPCPQRPGASEPSPPWLEDECHVASQEIELAEVSPDEINGASKPDPLDSPELALEDYISPEKLGGGALQPTPPWISAEPPAAPLERAAAVAPATPEKPDVWGSGCSVGSTESTTGQSDSREQTEELDSEETSASDRGSGAVMPRLQLQEMARAARRRCFVTPGRRRHTPRASARASPAPPKRGRAEQDEGEAEPQGQEAESGWETASERGGAESEGEGAGTEAQQSCFRRAATAPASVEVGYLRGKLERLAQERGEEDGADGQAPEAGEEEEAKDPEMWEDLYSDEEDFLDCDDADGEPRKRRGPRQFLPSLLEDTSSRYLWEVNQARANLRNPLTRPRSHHGSFLERRQWEEVKQVRAMLRPSPGPRKSSDTAAEGNVTPRQTDCAGFERLQGKLVGRKSSLADFMKGKMSQPAVGQN